VNADAVENAVASTNGKTEKIALFIAHSFSHTPKTNFGDVYYNII
jgi:hypothetical protein